MTREELRKKRKELAESKGYAGFIPYSQRQKQTQQQVQQPVTQPTTQPVTQPINNTQFTQRVNELYAQNMQMTSLANANKVNRVQAANSNNAILSNLKSTNTEPIKSVTKKEAKQQIKESNKLEKELKREEYDKVQEEREAKYQEDLKNADNLPSKIATATEHTISTAFQKPRALYDGFQASDIVTIPGSTVVGAAAHTIEGVKSVGDAVANTGAYGVASIADIAGAKGFSKRLVNAIKANEQQQREATDKVNSLWDKNSLLGKSGNQAFESTGQSSVFGALGSAGYGKAAGGLTFAMGASGGFSEAYNDENTKGWEAALKAAGSGAASYVTENMFDWMGYGGNKITKGLKEKVGKMVGDGLASGLARLGFSAVGEGAEEIAEEVLNKKVVNALINKVISENKYDTSIDISETVANALVAMFSVAGSGAAPTIAYSRYQSQQQAAPISESEAISQIIREADLNQEEKKSLERFAERNNLNAEQVESLIQNNAQEKQNQIEQDELNELAKGLTEEQAQEILNGESSFEDKITQIDEKKAGNERARNLLKSIDEYNNSRKEGEKVFDINDENTRKEIESIQKIAQDRGINITFDESRFNNSSDNAFYEYDEEGNVANIVLNPNATTKKYVQNLTIHELVHSFGGKEKSKLMKTVLDYAYSLSGSDPAYQDLKNAYVQKYGKNVSESIIEEEAVANILGEKLGDKQFVNDLINGTYNKDKTLLDKIYDFVKNQINRFRGYKDQEQYWTHVKELFDDAYRNSEINREGLKNSVEANKMTNIKDSQGRQLSEGQVEYFKDSKVRDDNGNLLKLYHGTNADFNEFTRGGGEHGEGFYFTDDSSYAEEFADDEEDGRIVESYLNIKNPLSSNVDINSESMQNLVEKIQNKWGLSKEEIEKCFKNNNENWSIDLSSKIAEKAGYGDEDVAAALGWEYEEGEDLADEIGEDDYKAYLGAYAWNEEGLNKLVRESGFDGIISKTYNSDNEGIEYIAFNSNQIKNTDNLNPSENPDIRYSTDTDNIETRKDGTLLAMHNLSENNFLEAFNLGGLPNPSIAITNPDIVEHNQFGDITAIFNKDTIDPRNTKNKVYDRDVWSPTFPEIAYNINNNDIQDMQDNNNIYLDYSDPISSQVDNRFFDADNLSNLVERYGLEGTLDTLKDSKELQYIYMRTNDKNFQPVYSDKKYDDSSFEIPNYVFENFLNNYDNKIPLNEARYEYNQEITEALRPYVDELIEKDSEKNPELRDDIKKAYEDLYLNNYTDKLSNVSHFLMAAYKMQQDRSRGIRKTIDQRATLEKVQQNINKDEFNNWVDNTFGNMLNSAEKGIRNDKPYFDKYGNRRKFNQIYDSYTLDNLVKIMSKQDTVGGQKDGLFGKATGKVLAELSHKFTSIKDIKKNEGRLTTRELASEVVNPLVESLREKTEEITKTYTGSSMVGGEFGKTMQADEYIRESLFEFAKQSKSLNIDTFRKILNDYMFDTTKISDDLLLSIKNDLEALREIPTDYFEAKPQRAVSIDEIKSVVAPNTVGKELRQKLAENGIKLIEYDPNIEGDREAKLKSAELQDLRFSKDVSGAWNNFIEKNFKNTGEGTAIQDLKKLPTKKITIDDFSKVLDNYKNIPQADKQAMLKDLENINLTKESLDEFKNTAKLMSDTYSELEQDRFKSKSFDNEDRKKLIAQKRNEFNKDYKYDDAVIDELDSIIPRNRNGRRTVENWKRMAKEIGVRIADLSPEQIEDIAVKSYYDLEPSKNITQYDKGDKKSFEKLYANDWVNEVFEGVRENRQFAAETSEKAEEEVKPPKQKKTLNPTEIANLKLEDASTTPILPDKKYKKGDKQSQFVSNINDKVGFLTDEEKQAITSDENVQYYASITNAETMAKAYKELQENGKAETESWYAKKSEETTADDVAKGWILLKQYKDSGNTQGMVNVAKKLRDMGTKAGQTVQAFNIMSRLTPEGMVAYTQGELQDAYNNMVQGKTKKWIDQHKGDFDLSQEEVAFIMDTMQNLPAENPDTNNYERKVALGQIQKLFTDKIPTDGNGIKAWMRISMLFNPKTQVRNVAGNAAVIPVNMFSDFLGSKADKLISKYTGLRTLGNPNVKSYLKGMKDGFYQSYNDFRLGINTRDLENNKFEFGDGKAFKNKGIGKALNRVDNILNFVMDFGDRGFSQAAFVNSINNQMVLNNVTQPTQEMIDIATNEALSRTWNDSNDYTRLVLSIRGALNKIGTKNYGLGDVLIPFAKTPANLTKAIVDYSPVGLASSIWNIKGLKNAIETGQITPKMQHEFVDRLGKGLAGSLLYVAGYALAKAGITSGEPDDDKDVKNFMRNSLGIAPYSIKIGDKTFTYDWSQPIATPLAIMANYEKMSKDNPDAKMIDKVLGAVDIGTNQLLEQSFMESINEVLNGNGTVTERIQQAIFDLPARAIPTFSKQIADLVDGTQRTTFEYNNPTQSAINSAKAKLPGLSKTLTPSIDTLGNEIQKYGGENNWFNVFFNPANMNKGEKTKAGQEIYDVYMATGDTTVFPATAPYYVNRDGGKITMDSKQRARYQKISGDYAEQTINKLLNDPDYNKLDADDKAEIISKVVTDSKERANKDVLNITNKSSDLDVIDKVGADYYTFKLSTKGMKEDVEMDKVLKNKSYSNKNKQELYGSEINSKDKAFGGLKQINSNFDMDSYLDYKINIGTFKGDDKKEQILDYLSGLDMNYDEKLYLYGQNYKLNTTELQDLENELLSKMTTEQAQEVLSTLRYNK